MDKHKSLSLLLRRLADDIDAGKVEPGCFDQSYALEYEGDLARRTGDVSMVLTYHRPAFKGQIEL